MSSNVGYYRSEVEFDDLENVERPREKPNGYCEKVYTYDEAIDLTGTGWYNYGVLVASSTVLMAMAIDMYGFSFIVPASSCEFQLDLRQKSILLTIPFVGPLIMAYPWGYISDTQGRRKCLFVGSLGTFIAALISAFSVNWIMLIICKLISTSFCSCAQSITYAWISESCPNRVKGAYMIAASSFVMLFLAVCAVPAYFILPLGFSYILGTISFTPWRLLAVLFALPSGINFFIFLFFYESPKFVLKTGRNEEALWILRRMYERNGGHGEYPVKAVVLAEAGNVENKKVSLWKSLRDQTLPIFKPPYIWRTLQLYVLVAILLGCTNGLYVWFPFIAMTFYEGINDVENSENTQGLCNVIMHSENQENEKCSTIDIKMVWICLFQGIAFFIINICIVSLSSRKKAITMTIMVVCCLSSIGIIFISDPYNISSFLLFFGVLLNGICIGIIYMYTAEIYPTSYRGMSSSIALFVGRVFGLVGVNVIGSNILQYCHETFYTVTVIFCIAFILACFLPPDRPKKTGLQIN